MNRFFIIALLAVFALASCSKKPTVSLSDNSIIPKPVHVSTEVRDASGTRAAGAGYSITAATKLVLDDSTAGLQVVADYLAAKLRPSTGFPIEIVKGGEPTGIHLSASKSDSELGDEGYEMTITESAISIQANTAAGAFRGVQTLRQLLPASIESSTQQAGPWTIAGGTIRDYPKYKFRGVMLDLGRHFFGVGDIKRYIDLVAAYKINVMHLHLSDDQGWRIEIKKWPKLTETGSKTQVGGGDGGFLTQDQYKDIVKFAADRFITIIPEIDSPGHTNAALASYAELNCNGKAPELYSGTKVGFSTLCAKKDITYKFMDDVIGELADMTPGPYIHIGGDESHATEKQDYILFINKVKEIVKAHGKTMIGWDETSQADLQENAVAQFWANEKFAAAAVGKGAKLIMSPAKKAYMDMSYDSTQKIGYHWAAYIEVDSAYLWDPATYAAGVTQANILGVESPLWTETIKNMKDIEYMVFPRVLGYGEIGWSPDAGKNWDEYKLRLAKHGPRMAAQDINFYRSKLVPWEGGNTSSSSGSK